MGNSRLAHYSIIYRDNRKTAFISDNVWFMATFFFKENKKIDGGGRELPSQRCKCRFKNLIRLAPMSRRFDPNHKNATY